MVILMSGILKEKSIGILYCNVMGLMKINDAQRHQAGDDLLIRAK